MKSADAAYWVEKLDMIPHPEGGYCREMYRSDLRFSAKEGTQFPASRRWLTTIYYLLEGEQVSSFHRIKSPETWFFHKGDPLLIYFIDEAGEMICRELSDRPKGELQLTVPPNCWFAAALKERKGFVLVSCAVAPGFEYEDFELADARLLMQIYPQHADVIRYFCPVD